MQKKKNATTKKGSRNVMGAEPCLAHDMGGGGIGGPLSVDMRPYGCFILFVDRSSMIGSLESIKHLDILKYYITYLRAGNNFTIPMNIVIRMCKMCKSTLQCSQVFSKF